MKTKRSIKEIMKVVKEEWPHYSKAKKNELGYNIVKNLDNKLYNIAKQLKW